MRLACALLFAVVLLAIVPSASSQPETTVLTAPGLRAPVEIVRDARGVPHIYAANPHDLFFAQGYVQAQDRWWQMEWWRHTARGQLGELAGRALLGTDIMLRTFGFEQVVARELAEVYDAQTLGYLQAFADGVNAYIAGRVPGALAMQYNALRLAGVAVEVKPWTPDDSLLWGKMMALGLTGSGMRLELLMAALLEKLSPEMAYEYAVPYPYGEKPTILRPDELPAAAASAAHTAPAVSIGIDTPLAGGVSASFAADVGLGSGLSLGSNSWVISGARTASGLPLLANDTHMGVQMPSTWYEVGLHCQPLNADCPFSVRGFAFSPTPGVVIGRTPRIAWGFTNSQADVQDLYIVRVNPDNPLQYEWDGVWRDMTAREETIRFGDGAEPVTIQVRRTHLGPIINDNQLDESGAVVGFNTENPLALRWTALDPGTLFRAVMLLNRAQNWDNFRDAMSYFDVPAQNAVYADVDGNIGYQLPGRMPVRAGAHDGMTPAPGWDSAYEWRGFIPYDSLPRVLNPERGYIVTANNAIVPESYYGWLSRALADQFGPDARYRLAYFFAYGYRAQRIEALIEASARHTVSTTQAIQGDNYEINADVLLPYLARLTVEDPAVRAARDRLLTWDRQMSMDSAEAALYAAFWARLVTLLFNDQLEGVLKTDGNNNVPRAVEILLEQPESLWWDDLTTRNKVEQRDDILHRALAEAHASLIETLGPDESLWRWGDLHTTTFVSEPLGMAGIATLETLVNLGPVATSGSTHTVNATQWDASRGDFAVTSLPSMRMIVDLAAPANSLSVISTGQSGDPFSPHYGDQVDPWRFIRHFPMHWERSQIDAAAVSRLVLRP